MDDDPTGQLLVLALKNDIALLSLHTNLDNTYEGVNHILSKKIGLKDQQILRPMKDQLIKLVVFCPLSAAEIVRSAIFEAGAGVIGNYDCCSYNVEGKGSFRAGEKANPFVGNINEIHFEDEIRIETILPVYIKSKVIRAMISAHPYEEVAYDVYPLLNKNPLTGAGMIGELTTEMNETDFMKLLKDVLGVPYLRHSRLKGEMVSRVALCGGSGSFLMEDAIHQGADTFITADIKYHQFFSASGRILLIDAGHFETEQFTVELIASFLKDIFPNFAVHISKVAQNPVNYL
jgi:dinuclear metal center YbgI/SA1388 family protein